MAKAGALVKANKRRLRARAAAGARKIGTVKAAAGLRIVGVKPVRRATEKVNLLVTAKTGPMALVRWERAKD
jgi:hypothetical protein